MQAWKSLGIQILPWKVIEFDVGLEKWHFARKSHWEAVKVIEKYQVEELNIFYASAFRRRRHYVFGLSVRPSVRLSVRSLKYPLLTCTWVRWSTRPTVTVLRHVRPSVRPSVCPSVRLSVRPSGEVSGHLPQNAWREWPEILHADVSWPSSELISLWPQSVDFSNFGAILT